MQRELAHTFSVILNLAEILPFSHCMHCSVHRGVQLQPVPCVHCFTLSDAHIVLTHLHNVETLFHCPQTSLSLGFHCSDDVSESKSTFSDSKEPDLFARCMPIAALLLEGCYTLLKLDRLVIH